MSKISARYVPCREERRSPRLWLVLGMTLMISILLFGCNDESKKQSLAVVDAEAVFQKSALAAVGMKRIDDLNTDLQTRLAKMQGQLIASPNDAELESRLQNELFQLQTRMDQSQREIAEKVNGIFESAVEECRIAAGADVVLPRQLVITMNPAIDITDQVIAAMDKQSIDLAGISLGEPQAEPEQAGQQEQAGQTGDNPAQSGQPEQAEQPEQSQEQPQEQPAAEGAAGETAQPAAQEQAPSGQ